MAESTTVVSLPQMVDLALNSPEVGIVNFTVLHSLLHVIVNQLELTDTNVEFRGSDSERLQSYISTARPGPLLTLTEYTIGEPASKKPRKKGKRPSVLEKGKKDEEHKEKTEKKRSVESVASDTHSTVVVIDSSKGNLATSPQFTVAVTKTHFDKLQADIQRLDVKMKELSELPGNSALIQAMRSDSVEQTPILDMFQILSLSKRLDAAEVVMEKIASMVEDKGKQGLLSIDEDKSGSVSSASDHPELSEIIERIDALEKNMVQLGEGEMVAFQPKAEPGAAKEKKAEAAVDATDIVIESVDLGALPSQTAVRVLQTELVALKEHVQTLADGVADLDQIKRILSAPAGDTSENLPADVRLNQVEIKFNDLMEQLNSLDNVYNQQTSTLQDRIGDLEKEFNEIIEKIKLGLPAGDANAGMEGQSMSDMYNTLMQVQDDVHNMTVTAQKLMEERDERQHALDVMLEQVELLKTVKADREDLEDALAEKADACQINKKVSLEQFDAVCVDMSKAIEEALGKLTDQEMLWTQALDDIQKDVGNKLDKMELTPLRDFINKKLKHLQEKVRTLSAMKKENEAAGTRTRFLKDVNCISCDKDVIMRKEVDSSLYPRPYALPPTRNMGPYLAYELDQLRKQQKCLPQSKNLNAFESAMHSARSTKSPDHICNRYCGGSHTVTTPQQRVTRIGHFLEQWGPEIGPAQDTNIRGTDGQMYKGRDEKALLKLMADKGTAGGTGQIDPSQASTPTTTPGGTNTAKLKSAEASKSRIPSQGSAGGIAGRPGTEVSGPKVKTSTTSASKKNSGAEIGVESPEPPTTPAATVVTDGGASQTGASSPKKSGSKASLKGSKSSLPKSPSKHSGDKIETVPEESEPPAAEEA